jgi:hypothetical protein
MNAPLLFDRLSDALRRDPLSLALRAFVSKAPEPEFAQKKARRPRKARSSAGPSEYTLVFDTETTTDASQRLRIGCYQFRRGDVLDEQGLFFDPSVLSIAEQELLAAFAKSHGLKCMTKAAFIDDIFYGLAYDLRATILGFNLPFDLSRLAVRHNSARGKMRGGFSFQLSEDKWKARVQVKHLTARAALIQFAARRKHRATKGDRKKKIHNTVRRGSFIDLKTVAAALLSRSFTLATLADFLKTPTRKASTDEHGGPLTNAYLTYAVQDVQATWECFSILSGRFDAHRLGLTRLSQVLSEASLGKAYLKQMNVRPWRELQRDMPNELIGLIMSTYFGGRAEVHLRRMICQVLYCDFLSMYPTVCTLMGLWRFVIAKGMTWRDATVDTAEFLSRTTLADLQKPETWPLLTTLVQIVPDDNILPVRAKYSGEAQATIGVNYLSSDAPLWITLADCLASKLLTGRPPKILKALRFTPGGPQDNLKPVSIGGSEAHNIDPATDDFYRRLIDLRGQVTEQLETVDSSNEDDLESQKQALKTLANSTSYGIFVELIVEELDTTENRLCFGSGNDGFPVKVNKVETPGRYFHPLLATLITGAARLMLATAERLTIDAGLDWAFCDTDSMAIAKPEGMSDDAFFATARSVCDWFAPLNPYEKKGPLFKIEKPNFALDGSGNLTPLFCFAISSKRYALFNLDGEGRPVIRKASAHGLGHLLPPYQAEDAPKSIPAPCMSLDKIGVERWQYDLWFKILEAALAGHPDTVDLDYDPRLKSPTASRYAATSPVLLRWFDRFNEGHHRKVGPFNFLLSFQARLDLDPTMEDETSTAKPRKRRRTSGIWAPKPVAPYDKDNTKAATLCFDRETGKPVSVEGLKSYVEALAQYHLHPEMKFLDGDYLDRGATQRRHVRAIGIRLIGKEANHWEEQFFLGLSEDAQIEYGIAPENTDQFREVLRNAAAVHGMRQISRVSGIVRNTLSRIIKSTIVLSGRLIEKLTRAITELDLIEAEQAGTKRSVREQLAVEIKLKGLRKVAKERGVDASNLRRTALGGEEVKIEADSNSLMPFHT